MADLFTLFDGSMGAGGGAGVSRQSSDSFSEVSSENDLVATLASGSDSVDLLIDYSDFANFVTFNSAESYVTVTADQILNSFPRDGTADDVQVFVNSLDGYQRYFLENWPARTGHLRFSAASSSFVRVDDFGVQDGAARTSFVSPGTGSLSIQGWIDVQSITESIIEPVFHKARPDNSDGLTVFVSGSSLFFRVASGSISASISASLTSMPMFFAAVLDRSSATGSVLLYTGTTGSYPSLVSSTQVILGQRFDLASGSFYFGSGSVPSRVSRTLTGSIDAISIWSTARTLSDMSGTYNRRIHAQSGLIGLWNFNDATPSTPPSYAAIVRDSSGHRLDGRIQLFHSGVLGSGSLVFDSPDPILSLDDPNVVSYVVSAQVSGALYDRDNQSLIFNLFPDSFSQGDQVSADVFRNFALILARHFDRIKVYVNQLANLKRVHYGDFDQAPDEILDHVARSFGWELGGGFATTDALRYFIGRNVTLGPGGNDGTSLSGVKAAFWRRILLNLMYLYKTKGTGESVEALLRTYGVDSGFIRLKEYARRTESPLLMNRVDAEKSVYSMRFSNGSNVLFSYDAPLIPSTSSFFAIVGDSNSNGKADPAKADSAFDLSTNFTSIQFNGRSAAGASVDPPVWTDFDLDMAMRTLAPRSTSFGFEMGLGSVLQGPIPNSAISQIGIDGASLSGNYLPTSAFMLASTGVNLFGTWVARQQAFEISLGKKLSGVVVSLGTNDAGVPAMASGFQANMTAFIAAIRAVWPNIPIAWVKTNPTTTGAGVATVIAAQNAVAALDSKLILIDNSDLALATDALHYGSNPAWTIGVRAGIGILDTMGIPRRAVTGPTVIGWGPAEFGTGSLFPNSAGDVRKDDIEIMAVLMGVSTGSFTIGTPSGWIPVTSSNSTSSGVTQHLALFSRPVTVAGISGALGHASSSMVSGSDNRMTAKVFNVRGSSGINASLGFGPNTFGSGPSNMTGVTASAGSSVLAFACGWCGSSPSTTLSNSTLLNFGKVQDGAYVNVFTDRSVIALATGSIIAPSGSSGNTEVMTSANMIELGATVAFGP